MADLRDITLYDRSSNTIEETIVDSDGRVHVRTKQRCDPVIEAVKGARDLPRGKNMRHVGSIPLTLYYKWMQEAGIQPGEADTTRKMREIVLKKMQSNEFQNLVVHGR